MHTKMNRSTLSGTAIVVGFGVGLVLWGACTGETTLLYKVSQTAGASGGSSGEVPPGTGGMTPGADGTGGAGQVSGSGGMTEPTGTGSGGTTGSGGMGALPGSTGGGAGTGSGTGGASGAAGNAGTGGANTGTGGTGTGGAPANDGPIQVLVWNNALAFGHASRVNALPYFKARENTDNIRFDTTYAHTGTALDGPSDTSFDASVFTDAGLDRYDVVLFLNTTGTTIDDGQRAVRRQALQDFILKKGRGFVGTHSATDTYQNGTWPWYVDFIGTNFSMHSNAGTPGTAKYYQNMTHPILTAAATPNPWNRAEEWYTLARNPLSSPIPGVRILLSCQDQSITAERASAWIHEMPLAAGAPRAGRMFYTAMGHATSAFMEKPLMDLIINGIKWAAHRIN